MGVGVFASQHSTKQKLSPKSNHHAIVPQEWSLGVDMENQTSTITEEFALSVQNDVIATTDSTR
jgi:hypothetical protein